MTICKHELKANRVSLTIWTVIIASVIMLIVLMYPAFKDQMAAVSSIFNMLGPLTAAMGLDKMDFTTGIGFYAMEIGHTLAIGGALFAGMTGIVLLSKEEGGHTAEFLLTMPVSRCQVVAEKLLALVMQIILLNLICCAAAYIAFLIIGEPLPVGRFLLFHGLQCVMHVEIACVCFALSAFARRMQVGMGLGLALLLYFVNLIANMLDTARFLRYFTPFAYAESSVILTGEPIEIMLVCIGVGVTLFGAGMAFWQYGRKDIAS